MSIYSGFATRFQQEAYDHCVDSMLYVLQKRIIRFYSGEQTDEERFLGAVGKLHQQMKKMQKNKYLEPKSSEALSQLVRFVQQHGASIVANQPVQPVIKEKIQPKVEEATEERTKKNVFWVERVVEDSLEDNTIKQANGTEGGKIDATNKQAGSKEKDREKPQETLPKQDKIQFRRTSYQNYPSSAIRGIRIKNSSRNSTSGHPNNMPKSRASSQYLNSSKPPLQPMQSEPQTQVLHKFTNTSSQPWEVKAVATRGQAQEIVREYILKMKKQRKRGRSEHNSRPLDF